MMWLALWVSYLIDCFIFYFKRLLFSNMIIPILSSGEIDRTRVTYAKRVCLGTKCHISLTIDGIPYQFADNPELVNRLRKSIIMVDEIIEKDLIILSPEDFVYKPPDPNFTKTKSEI